MNAILEASRIPYSFDGRRKISDEQKQTIRRLHEVEQLSIHTIAKQVGVSKRSVQFILFPERAQVVRDRAKAVKRWTAYNTPQWRTPAMRKHRAKKRALAVEGLLPITPEIIAKAARIKERKRLHGRQTRRGMLAIQASQ